MGNSWAQYFQDPKVVLLALGAIVLVSALVWLIRKISRPPEIVKKTQQEETQNKKGGQIHHRAHNVPDAGPSIPSTLVISPDGKVKQVSVPTNIDLTAPVPKAPTNELEAREQFVFNTQDRLIDPRIQYQWSLMEMRSQQNDTPERNGQIWLKNWENLGPLPALTPTGEMGPQDPQLSYGLSIASAMDEQAKKFCVSENPNDITYAYKNQLQQLPGSHFVTFTASSDPYETPQVVNRFSQLAIATAQWVVFKLNEEIRKEHPCFSLAQKEHFELSNPPQACEDQAGAFVNPISLIRVFECRVGRRRCDEAQLVYLTMEIGNQISSGSGGMFSTVVTINNKGEFVDYTNVNRDEKQTFVLPRTRTDAT